MDIHLPRRYDPTELVNAVTTAYRVFALDLGAYYESKLAPHDPQWLLKLQNVRRKPLTLRDPYFVLDEPLRNRDSPTRACLPRSDHSFWKAMEAARMARNRWTHAEEAIKVPAVLAAIRPLTFITATLHLPCKSRLDELVERLQAIMAGRTFDEPVDSAAVTDLMQQLEAEQQQRVQERERAAEAYAAAQAEWERRSALEAETGDLTAQLAALRGELEAAMDGWGRAVAMAEEAAERQAAEHEAELTRLRELVPDELPDIVLPDGLAPGDVWPEDLPVGGRDLDLKAAFRDFLEVDTGAMLGDKDGLPLDEVRLFAEQCLEVVPDGGIVYVDHCGHVVRWGFPSPLDITYLGTMPREWLRS